MSVKSPDACSLGTYETEMAAHTDKCSILTILRKNRGLEQSIYFVISHSCGQCNSDLLTCQERDKCFPLKNEASNIIMPLCICGVSSFSPSQILQEF